MKKPVSLGENVSAKPYLDKTFFRLLGKLPLPGLNGASYTYHVILHLSLKAEIFLKVKYCLKLKLLF